LHLSGQNSFFASHFQPAPILRNLSFQLPKTRAATVTAPQHWLKMHSHLLLVQNERDIKHYFWQERAKHHTNVHESLTVWLGFRLSTIALFPL